jgi:hypothetical protein
MAKLLMAIALLGSCACSAAWLLPGAPLSAAPASLWSAGVRGRARDRAGLPVRAAMFDFLKRAETQETVSGETASGDVLYACWCLESLCA